MPTTAIPNAHTNESHEAKVAAYENAITYLGKWFEAHRSQSKEYLEDTEADFEALPDTYDLWRTWDEIAETIDEYVQMADEHCFCTNVQPNITIVDDSANILLLSVRGIQDTTYVDN
ncbi:hypothetical protein TMatcc_000927 [Talaromyces marneffei ATCC 18224]